MTKEASITYPEAVAEEKILSTGKKLFNQANLLNQIIKSLCHKFTIIYSIIVDIFKDLAGTQAQVSWKKEK